MDNDDKQAPSFMITVRTAQCAPSWMPWAIYAMLIATWYGYHASGNDWFLVPIGVVAATATHLFFDTYNALTRMFNERIIREAVMAQFQSQEKQAGTPQIQTVKGVKLVGTDTKVDPGVISSEAVTLKRYEETLTWINKKAKFIGEARDRAWRALEHDQMTAKVKANAVPPAIDKRDG